MRKVFFVLRVALVAGLPTILNTRAPQPILGLANITEARASDLKSRAISNAQLGIDFPDPSIIFGDGSWKAYGTTSAGKSVPVAISTDAWSWTITGNDAMPKLGAWVDPDDLVVWAPDVQKNDNGMYVMYYTAHQNGGSHCIGVATSSTAIGPFTPNESPLICDSAGGGVIDASGYDDGTDRWIVWKVDGNSLGGGTTCQGGTPSGSYKSTPIKIQRMARDATTLLDSPKTILDNEGAANDGVVEAPALYKISNGNFVLFYSSHCWASDDYDIEYAFSSTIDGSYTNRGILLRSADNKGIWAPGGLDIDPNGSSVIFHGRTGPNMGGYPARQLYSAALTMNGKSVVY